jgi:hypothetical protein
MPTGECARRVKMKRTAVIVMMIVFGVTVSFAASPAKKQLSDKEKAQAVVQTFLEKMDAGKYEEAYSALDFDALLLDQTKKDPSKLPPQQKETQIKAYKNLAKNMFLSEKKQTKFRNFSFGAFNKTGDKATLELINTPPKGAPGAPIVKIFKLISVKGEWRIYGNTPSGPAAAK